MKIFALLIAVVSFVSLNTQAADEKVCAVSTPQAQYLAGLYIGHQSVMSADFLQGQKATGILPYDLQKAFVPTKVIPMKDCQYLVLALNGICGWEVVINGNVGKIDEKASGYFCRKID